MKIKTKNSAHSLDASGSSFLLLLFRDINISLYIIKSSNFNYGLKLKLLLLWLFITEYAPSKETTLKLSFLFLL